MNIFLNNLNSLNNPYLAHKLSNLKENSFEKIDNGGGGFNFRHRKNKLCIYENPQANLQEKLEFFQSQYFLYPVLYFYGFGSGILYKALLKNSNLKHIVVFEDEIELLFCVLHHIDFSAELRERKIIILNSEISDLDLTTLFRTKPFYDFLRVYDIHLHSEYYECYGENIIKLNQKISNIIKTIVFGLGNDLEDALTGISQFIYNFPKMIENPPLKKLWMERNFKSKTAIIVSTGPSLTKQLPLLKKYQAYFSIFCADSAYSILARENIKPDYVLMSERSEVTSKLIEQNYENIDKDIVFILLALVHPSAIKCLEQTNRKYILVPYPTEFLKDLNLEDFGQLTSGNTVALNALELACALNHENIVFIGQDLAFSEDGASHAKNYIYGYDFESEYSNEKIQVLGYGGKKYVQTHNLWNIFRLTMENFISTKNHFCFYNATEGGAFIKGTLEKSFKQCCEDLADKTLSKPFLYPKNLEKHVQDELLLKVYAKIEFLNSHCDEFILNFTEHLNTLTKALLKIQNSCEFSKAKEDIKDTILKLDEFKTQIEKYCFGIFYECINPFLSQFELNLARIYVINPRNEKEWLDKNLTWIKDHIFLFEVLIANIKLLKEKIQNHLAPLTKELMKRKLKANSYIIS
ncbi:motility associated factor glycosyltransferase family protein [Campylobacter sp. VTCC 70190]|uniref:motility associated factor glycosyltransferase family protein n=1 Tax=Campylobacter sp. VTCC 70190 TaxID=3392118 RepID=UPI00398F50C9